MTITLLAVSLNDSPLSQPITASFDARGGTIGRADHNTMALPDPERHISRLQAEVLANGPRFLIKNVGAANPITVAGRQLMVGDSATLSHHDDVRIGGYMLRVVDDARSESGGASIARGRAQLLDTLAGQANSPDVRQAMVGPDRSSRLEPLASTPASPGTGGGLPASYLPEAGDVLSSSNPFADLLGSGDKSARRRPSAVENLPAPPATDPFADLLPPPAGLPGNSKALGNAAKPSETPLLPDDFDPFAAPKAPDAAARETSRADPFADLIPDGESRSIDAMFGLRTDPVADDALARFGAASSTGQDKGLDRGLSTDPLALFGAERAPDPSGAAPFADHTPKLHASFAPPKWVDAQAKPRDGAQARPAINAAPPAAEIPVDATWLRPPSGHRRETDAAVVRPDVVGEPFHLPAPSPPVPPETSRQTPVPQPSSAARDVDADLPSAPSQVSKDALWSAFCSGVGADVHLTQGLDVQTMQALGQLMRAAVAGTLQLIAVRASTKHELRADVTMIQARSNNPLKFSPDVQTALEQLLNAPMRGFLAGPAAMTDAMNDLVGHSIGTMAGMRAALDGVLARFEPSQLESKLSGTSLLDSLLPMNRRARLWDLYLQHFDAIREEAQDDFHTLFGRAFVAAYEQQIERLKSSRSSEA